MHSFRICFYTEICDLLGNYTASCGNCLPVFTQFEDIYKIRKYFENVYKTL